MMTSFTAPPYPWEFTRAEMLRYWQTKPRPRMNLHKPQRYTEAELHRVGFANRHLETEPPDVPAFPVGTWCMAGSGALFQLRRMSIYTMKASEAEKPPLFVQKYVRWYQDGSPFPPIRLLETDKQSLQITDGHHRYQAAQYLGLSHLMAWVGLAWYQPTRSGLHATDFTYRQAVQLALQMGLPVSERVRQQAGAAGVIDHPV